jgi:hypothetical protein
MPRDMQSLFVARQMPRMHHGVGAHIRCVTLAPLRKPSQSIVDGAADAKAVTQIEALMRRRLG